MEGIVDPFATKGVEYLIAVAFLLLLVGFWRLVGRPRPVLLRPVSAGASGFRPAPEGWFALRGGHFFHQGHSWAVPESADVVRVGMDDFAQKLLGDPSRIELPAPGTALQQGEHGWTVQVDSGSVSMLSPVDGEVVAVNAAISSRPDLVSREPYDDGWLLKVRVPNPKSLGINLLSGRLARAWMEETNERLRTLSSDTLGILLPDGGVPVQGFARALSPEDWVAVAEEFLLSG
ncbi:MAG: glycine cleavage system protein H [Gemmatimonadota bacterium]|jgi:glycine cleavage system H lipoate-binding protein|nr:MAG: glycine cleavage system protein H [Gemmatimonadota bacterium]